MKPFYALMTASLFAFSAAAMPTSNCLSTHNNYLTSDRPVQLLSKQQSAVQHRMEARSRHAASATAKVKSTANNPDDKTVGLINHSFAWATAGTEDAPEIITLDAKGLIPAELIGEADYGFGGHILGQAGGSLYIANDDFNGFLHTPDVFSSGTINVSFKAKSINMDFKDDEDWLTVATCDASTYKILKTDENTTTGEWAEYKFTLDGAQTPIFLEIFTDYYDVLIKDLVVDGFIKALNTPRGTGHSDFTDDSFVAHWTPVEKATGYFLTVYEYDDANQAPVVPYILNDQPVEGTSYKVEGITPGNIYYFTVQATDGRNYSDVSDVFKVKGLPLATGLQGHFVDGLDRIDMSWNAVTGANAYQVEMGTRFTAPEACEYTLTEADFSDFDSTGSLAYPEEPDEYYISPEGLDSWTFVMPQYVQGAVGVSYSEFFAMWGFPGMIQSSDFDLAQAEGRKVHLQLEIASYLGNDVEVFLADYNEDLGGYGYSGSHVIKAVPSDFTSYEFDLSGTSGRCIIVIRPVDGGAKKADVFVRKLKVSAALAQGATVTHSDDYFTSAGAETSYDAPQPVAGVTRTMSVTALQYDNEGYIRLASEPTASVDISAAAGVEGITTDTEAAAEYFNLQGMRVAAPAKGLYIRRQGKTVEKLIL